MSKKGTQGTALEPIKPVWSPNWYDQRGESREADQHVVFHSQDTELCSSEERTFIGKNQSRVVSSERKTASGRLWWCPSMFSRPATASSLH
jgi:hypothetical protein